MVRKFLSGIILVFAVQPAFAAPNQFVMDGDWEMSYSPQENLHKLMFVAPQESHGILYLYCEPKSNEIILTYEAPATDIRTYQPNVRSDTVIGSGQIDVEFDEVISSYRVSQSHVPDSPFFQSLASGSDLLVEDGIFKVDTLDGRLFREFARSCGGLK